MLELSETQYNNISPKEESKKIQKVEQNEKALKMNELSNLPLYDCLCLKNLVEIGKSRDAIFQRSKQSQKAPSMFTRRMK